MKSRLIVAMVVVVAGLGTMQADLGACGDKSLSAGGIRMQRAMAARYPAAILIYAPASSHLPAAAKELKLQETLSLVGHTYRQVASMSDLDAAIASGRFNVVMADYAELGNVQQRVKSAASHPAVIPVGYKLTKVELAQASKQSSLLVKDQDRTSSYLATIADAVRHSQHPN